MKSRLDLFSHARHLLIPKSTRTEMPSQTSGHFCHSASFSVFSSKSQRKFYGIKKTSFGKKKLEHCMLPSYTLHPTSLPSPTFLLSSPSFLTCIKATNLSHVFVPASATSTGRVVASLHPDSITSTALLRGAK